MVSNKRGRSIGDDATAEIIDRIIRESGMNNSAIDRASGGAIGYNRVRDIREKMKSGARISELLIICNACGYDPIKAMMEISKLANKMESEKTSEAEQEAIAEMLQQASDPVKYGLAALHDPNKEIEALGDAGPDWDDPA